MLEAAWLPMRFPIGELRVYSRTDSGISGPLPSVAPADDLASKLRSHPTDIVDRRAGSHRCGGMLALSGPLKGGKRAGDVAQQRLPPRVRNGQEAARELGQQALPPGRLERPGLAAQAGEEIVDLDPQRLCHLAE